MKLPLPPEQLKKLLVDEHLLTGERFDEMFTEAERKSQNIIDVLVSAQVADARYLSNLIANALGVKNIDFSIQPIDANVVKLLPENIARERQVILFHREESGRYDAAMLNPSDLETVEFLEQRLGDKVKPFLATEGDLNRGFAVYGAAVAQDFKKLIEDNVRKSLLRHSKNMEEAAADLPIVDIVNNILSYAIASRASDIHIEIGEEATYIRYRIDGVLEEVMSVTKTIHPAIAARLKLLAGLKIDEHFKPQDGRFRFVVGNQMIDVRVSVMPTFYGEKVEMRLLNASQKPPSLEEIGMSEEAVKVVEENLHRAFGMIISCGPTGSGKTTTLYSLMNMLNKPEVNITTVEDPIEYNMRYVNQTQINDQAGITFASGLRALLRQDPNVIMVGEIRDAETAEIAVQAALTGHLLLSSLHTNDAPTAVPRFFDLKVPPFLVSSVLSIVIAQRLVRKVCRTCIYSYEIDDTAKATIKDQLQSSGFSDEKITVPKILYKGKGCATCGGTGYLGRIGIFEVMVVTPPVAKVIAAPQFSLSVLSAEAHKAGMKTMFEDGLEKVELAQTTLEEVLRVIRE